MDCILCSWEDLFISMHFEKQAQVFV